MSKTWLLNITREIAIALIDNRLLVHDELLFTGTTFDGPAPKVLIDCKLSLTGWALDAKTHRGGICQELPQGLPLWGSVSIHSTRTFHRGQHRQGSCGDGILTL